MSASPFPVTSSVIRSKPVVRPLLFIALAGALTCTANAQVAGKTTVGISINTLEVVASGWSAKKQILGQTVFNDAGEKVGKVDDLIIAPDKSVSFAIVGAGGFVGLNRHDVAVAVDHFTLRDDGAIELPGASKAAIKALPEFEYAKPASKPLPHKAAADAASRTDTPKTTSED
jgi:hypothetical protein